MNILNNYEIKFDTIDVYGPFRVMHSVNELLSAYVTEFNSYSRASQLLNSINNSLASDQKRCGTTQGMISVITESGVTKLSIEVPEYVNESLQLDFELPTTHLKEIVEAWVSYLKEEANVSMVIEYLKELEDLNAMKLSNVFSNLPLAMGHILKMEKLYNNGIPFPKSLRELLYIAGNYCSVIDLGSDPFAYQMEIRHAINLCNNSINKPFFGFNQFGNQFSLVFLDDISEDPEVMDVQLGLGLNNEFIMKSGVTLSKLIIERIDDLKKRS